MGLVADGEDEESLFPTFFFSFFFFDGKGPPCLAAALGTCLGCLYGKSGPGAMDNLPTALIEGLYI